MSAYISLAGYIRHAHVIDHTAKGHDLIIFRYKAEEVAPASLVGRVVGSREDTYFSFNHAL